MEPTPCTRHGKTGGSRPTMTSYKNDSGLQGFESRGKAEKVWTNNTVEKELQRRLNQSIYKIITGKEAIQR